MLCVLFALKHVSLFRISAAAVEQLCVKHVTYGYICVNVFTVCVIIMETSPCFIVMIFYKS